MKGVVDGKDIFFGSCLRVYLFWWGRDDHGWEGVTMAVPFIKVIIMGNYQYSG